jgi:hypothetical protein
MSDSVVDLLQRMQQFDPATLYDRLLDVCAAKQPEIPAPAEPPAFDELGRLFRARRIRTQEDAHRLATLLGEQVSQHGRVPVIVPLEMQGGHGRTRIELENGKAFPIHVRLVVGRGCDEGGRPVTVQLCASWFEADLGPTEIRRVDFELTRDGEPRASFVVPVEIREGATTVGRVWLDVGAQSHATTQMPRVLLGRDPGSDLAVLGRLRNTILMHPEAARAFYGALIEEGRQFARTEEGRTWAARLAASHEMRRIRLAWEVITLSILDGADKSDALPSAWLDALYALAGRPDMEEALGHLPGNKGARR